MYFNKCTTWETLIVCLYFIHLSPTMHFIVELFPLLLLQLQVLKSFSNSSCPFVFLFGLLWMFYTLLQDYRLRFINVWQAWYKLGVHPRSLLTCSWGVVMLVVQCSQKCSAVTSKDSQEGWLSWGCQWSKVYHFVSNPFLIVGKESIPHLIYMMCMAHLCLLACILCTHVLEVVNSFF